ncbi:hypothetical protein ABEV74_10930 [Paenibacillus cisolokensis]|uniref:hypothetical protein n=1 Tax=Paenibacillus cisolokensis TaxID=1658519 RepID=UPI003D277ADC
MQIIPTRLYYEKATGNGIFIRHQQVGSGFVPMTVEEEMQAYPILSEYSPDAVGVVELEPNQYGEELAMCASFRVDPDTGNITFTYRTEEPGLPQNPRPPLTEEVAELNEQIAALMIDSAAKDTQLQQQDAIIADLMLQIAALQTASGGGGA